MHQRNAFLTFAALALTTLVRGEGRIPLEDFFRDYTFDEIEVSPDGSKVAALSKWKEHLNLYVIDLKTKRPIQLTGLTTQDVIGVRWIGSNRLIFTGRDDGYGTGGLFAIDADGRHSTTLAPSIEQQDRSGKSVTARLTEFLDHFGDSTDEILVTSNERREFDPDVYRMNVHTGVKRIVAHNPGDVRIWVADHKGAVRAGFGERGRERFLVYRDSPTGEWREVKRWDFLKGTVAPLAFDQANRLLYVSSNLDRNTAAMCLFDPATGEIVKQLFANDTYDADQVILSPADKSLLGFSYLGEKPEVVWVDDSMKDLQRLVDQELPDS